MRLLACVLVLSACQQESGRGPVALLDLDPATVPEGDAFATPVLLDGRRSTDLSDEGAPMTYSWRIEDADDGWRIEPGDVPPRGCGDGLWAPCVLVRFRGDHPVPVELTVTTENGTDTATVMLGLTVD